MPDISVRGGLKKPAPLRHPLPSLPPHSGTGVRMGAGVGAGVGARPRVRKARKSGRQMLGMALLVGGVALCGIGWAGLAPSERGWMLRLGEQTTVMKPVCVCDGHPPRFGSCERVGYLGAQCAEWGGEAELPLAAALAGGLALAGLGAALMRRRKVAQGAKVV